MNYKTPYWLLKLTSIFIGISGTFLILEFTTRLIPASDYLVSELPLKCIDPVNPDINCLFRKRSFKEGRYSKGSLPPFSIDSIKRTNDIGQFSDIDFKSLKTKNNNKLKVLSIGDSFVEALQVSNEETFHGRLNEYKTKSNQSLISTAIGSSGNAFPQYLINLFYAKKNIDLESTVLIFTIISNDFDRSFEKYLIQNGAFFTNKDPNILGFRERLLNNKVKIKRAIITQSSLMRYLYFNIDIKRKILILFCKFSPQKCSDLNILFNKSRTYKLEKFNETKVSTDVFLKYVSEVRPSKQEKNKTIFIVDANRDNIYDKTIEKEYFFELSRNYFIQEAERLGFQVLDMDKIFRNHYQTEKKQFEFINDGHWNSTSHKIISDQISNLLNLNK